MTPEQSKKIIYAIIIIALAGALAAFLYLVTKEKNKGTSKIETEKIVENPVADSSIDQNIINSLTAPSSGGGTSASSATIDSKIIESLTAPASTASKISGSKTGEKSASSSAAVDPDVLKSLQAPAK
jgi:hypothetical protein